MVTIRSRDFKDGPAKKFSFGCIKQLLQACECPRLFLQCLWKIKSYTNLILQVAQVNPIVRAPNKINHLLHKYTRGHLSSPYAPTHSPRQAGRRPQQAMLQARQRLETKVAGRTPDDWKEQKLYHTIGEKLLLCSYPAAFHGSTNALQSFCLVHAQVVPLSLSLRLTEPSFYPYSPNRHHKANRTSASRPLMNPNLKQIHTSCTLTDSCGEGLTSSGVGGVGSSWPDRGEHKTRFLNLAISTSSTPPYLLCGKHFTSTPSLKTRKEVIKLQAYTQCLRADEKLLPLPLKHYITVLNDRKCHFCFVNSFSLSNGFIEVFTMTGNIRNILARQGNEIKNFFKKHKTCSKYRALFKKRCIIIE